MQELSLNSFEMIVAIIGLLGLLLAVFWLLRLPRRSRRRGEGREQIGQQAPGLPEQTLRPAPGPSPGPTPPASPWWAALSKTRERFFRGQSREIAQIKEEVEEACIVSDLGVGNTQEAMAAIDWLAIGQHPESERVTRAKEALREVLLPWVLSSDTSAEDLAAWPARAGTPAGDPAAGDPAGGASPCVIWFVGVNGVGKTTSIAKLASELKDRGHSVLLAAGDTFRAAAGEQLEIWAERLGVPCVRGQAGADSSSVLFDAIQSAQAKTIQYVLCDSAGRLHNQGQLMEALKKNKRVMEKALPGSPHETLLVLDANTGQNMVNQAEIFLGAVQVTGLVLTKLDGTARGGAVVAVARKTKLPIRRLGLGETAADFVNFDAPAFAAALVGLPAPDLASGSARRPVNAPQDLSTVART